MTGTIILLAPAATETVVANGDTRTIHLHHAHTHEAIDATYMVDGQYDAGVLQKLNWFLRDWRRDEPTRMDPRLFDTIWEVYRESGSQQPIEVMSAYRSPETNAMLRRASRAVAEHSQHILGKAMDQHYVDVPMSRIREIAMRLQRGGVGFYPTAGTPFVHMDVGGVRHWPRMSYDQLARLFPDGKTVHIPSNGQPLSGYEEARAELEARGDSFNYPTAGEVKSKGFFAWLFGGGGDEEGDGVSERQAAGGGRASRGSAQRVASLDHNAVGTIPSDPVGMSGKDAGMHSFALMNAGVASPEPASPLPQAPRRRGRQDPVQTAALPAAPEPSAAQAQQALAAEMQRQADAKAAAQLQAAQAQQLQAVQAQQLQAAQAQQILASQKAEAAARETAAREAAVSNQADAATTMPAAAEPDPPVAPTVVATLPTPAAPLPPRRPVELAIAGPDMPLPPSRPAEMMARTDHAPTPGAPKRDAIAVLASADFNRSNLPALITQGLGQNGSVPSARVLSYAAPVTTPPVVPLPVARPQFVAARLDRSNFRSLTAATPASRNPARSGLGSAVSALRPAARADLGTLTTGDASASSHGFGARATDLSTDRFSGTAVQPLERVSTAVLRKAHATTTE